MNKNLIVLYVNSFLMNVSFFSFIPFLSYYITKDLLYSSILAGTVLMLRQISQQGLSLITGSVADKSSYRTIIAIGMITRGVGFLLFGIVTSKLGLLAAAVLSGLGGAFFEPASKAALVAYSTSEGRSMAFSIDKVVKNVGTVIAALLAGLLISQSFTLLSLLSSSLFFLGGILALIVLPAKNSTSSTVSYVQAWKTVLSDPPFVLFTLCMSGYWFLFMQIYVTIPSQAITIFHDNRAISWTLLVFAVTIVCLQLPIQKFAEKYSPYNIIKVGYLFLGGSLFVVGITTNATLFLVGMFFFSVGVILIEPTSFELTARLSKPGLTASYFGFSIFSLALGGGIGQLIGASLLDYGKNIGLPNLLWITCVFISLISIIGIASLQGEKLQLKRNHMKGAS
ncbi:MFS transporter [Bacillus salitolerans]|uniref:MFS transporter n=1 Tax=Bacillus salitolerans TaxID=1437434 RepID=A0ABW4LQB4_9BACI